MPLLGRTCHCNYDHLPKGCKRLIQDLQTGEGLIRKKEATRNRNGYKKVRSGDLITSRNYQKCKNLLILRLVIKEGWRDGSVANKVGITPPEGS